MRANPFGLARLPPTRRPMAFATAAIGMTTGLSQYAYRVLTSADPSEKVRLTQEAAKAWTTDRQIGERLRPPANPSRPSEPRIVGPHEMPSVKKCNAPTNVYYLHGLAHVELNAIDLCFDTMLRFCEGVQSELEWFDDWISIAADEAKHFSWLDGRLRALGWPYGRLPAHGIIWEGAEASENCRRTRLAIGQLVAEARGLDAGPRLAQRLVGTGDNASADIVRVIADEEVRHVQIGVKWFMAECERGGLDAIKEFHEIAVRVGNPGAFAPPFNAERRAAAGLTPEWYLPVAEMMQEVRAKQRAKQKDGETVGQNIGSKTLSG